MFTIKFLYNSEELKRLFDMEELDRRSKIASFFNLFGLVCLPCPIRTSLTMEMDAEERIDLAMLREIKEFGLRLTKCRKCKVLDYYFKLVLEEDD